MTTYLQDYATTLALVVAVTAVSTMAVIVWAEIRQSKQRENYYREQGRVWNEDEGGRRE